MAVEAVNEQQGGVFHLVAHEDLAKRDTPLPARNGQYARGFVHHHQVLVVKQDVDGSGHERLLDR